MRHGKSFNHLGRTASHRKAMLSNMASSLILNKRVTTTVAKAKALRVYVEPLITKAKNDSTHSRRVVFSYLQNKESVKELFGGVAEKVADRPGGYTRIFKLGNRLGDNADMAMIELVDFNEFMDAKKEKKTATKKRSRRAGSGKAKTTETKAAATEATEEVVEETPVAEAEEVVAKEEVVEETPKVEAKAEKPTAEETKEEESNDDEEKKEEK